MPKLPSIKPQKLIQAFRKIGYIIDRQRGSHVILYHPLEKRSLTIPMHIKDLPIGTLLSIIKQSGKTKEEFTKLLK